MAVKEVIKVFTGNRVALYIAGYKVGMAQSARCSESYNLQGASGIGDLHYQEWVPTQALYQVNVQSLMLYKEDLAQILADQAGGGSPVITSGLATLRGITYDIKIAGQVVDGIPALTTLTEQDQTRTIRLYEGCSFDSGNIEVTKHAILVMDASFRALRVTDTDDGTF